MLRILDSPNELLTMIVSFLHTKFDNIDKIEALANESTTSELVSAFIFLGNWLATNIISDDDASSDAVINKHLVFKLIGLISLKVPPVILLSGAFDLNWGMCHPHWLLHAFYAPINDRIIQLRSYVKPFSIYGHIVQYPPPFQLFKGLENQAQSPGLRLDSEIDQAYQFAILQHFKRLILNHAPLDVFRPLVRHRNSRNVLTRAIIDLIKELNENRDATHEQLIFAFSVIFLYVHAFTLSNQIDGQLLCEFLQSRPFVSPFCILAMINHIPPNLYLFNLLTPSELLKNSEQFREIRPSQYVMVNMVPDTALNGFIDKMPIILSNYFLSAGPYGETDSCNKKDDSDFLAFIHLSSATLYNKMKAVLSVARERKLGTLHVSAMGILLLQCITFSLQRTLGDCADTKMFTENFCSFVKTVFALLSTAFSDQLGVKFFDFTKKQTKLTDLTIRGAYSHLLPILLHHNSNEHLIPFCIHAAKDPETQKSARLMISKLLQCERVKLNANVVESLKNCDDALILLEYIDAIPDTTLIETCKEYEDLMKIRNDFMSKLRITPLTQTRNTFIIESVDCGPTQPILYAVDNMTLHNSAKEAAALIKQNNDNLPSVLRILSITNFLQNRDFSTLLVTKIQSLLAIDDFSEDGQSRFEIRPCDFALPIAQALVGRLLTASHPDLAYELLVSMKKPLLNDSAPLHWVTRFTIRFRSILPKQVLGVLDIIVSGLPCAKEFYIKSDTRLIFDIAHYLIENDTVLIQDPEVINREYQSPYDHAQAFAHCSLALSSYTDEQIAQMLTEPVYDLLNPWKKRDIACLCLARLATTMNFEVSYRFFALLMEKKSCEMALLAGRLFLMNARIDVFKMVCQNSVQMIRRNTEKLDYFMRMVMPSFHRLKGDDAVATALMCGLLESVTDAVPRVLQESVIDAVGLMYLKLKLHKSRATLINAAVNFSPVLKGIFAASLETVPGDWASDALKEKKMRSSAQMHKTASYTTGKH